MTETFAPLRLAPTFAERIWGKTDLLPWYASTGTHHKIGEAWLTGPQSAVETGPFAGQTLGEAAPKLMGGEFPLLIKLLFPDDKLSVQVHPDDTQAQAIGLARGKTECWYVLDAEPGATVACGLRPGATVAEVKNAVEQGTLESLLTMIPVVNGDMVFVDAGTVHAIGPGVTLLEVQQTCDVTYRLYDYGRPRELHLEAGLAVIKTETAAGKIAPQKMDGFTRLIDTRYFIVDRYEIKLSQPVKLTNHSAGCIVGLSGSGCVGGAKIVAGQAVVLPPGESSVEADTDLTFAWCWEPATK